MSELFFKIAATLFAVSGILLVIAIVTKIWTLK